MLFRLNMMLGLILLAQASLHGASAGTEQSWQVDGVERTGLVFAPDSAKTEPAPLIFAFHGHGGTVKWVAAKFNYQQLWPEAIVVYLQGLNTPGQITDPDGKRPGWQSKAGDQNDRDLKFFDAVLKWAKQTYKVDDKRIYCTGHSNGGSFTYILWAQRGDVFAAVAPACASAVRSLNDLKPKPLLHIAGTQDPIVKFAWQEMMINSVRKINGCDPEGKPEGDRIIVYPSATGTPVETYIYDGGHTPPPEAWAEVVKFFKAHSGK
jgi:polyhydroxybutyrate depolymerase